MSTPPPNSMDRIGIADSNVRPIENNRRSQHIPLPLSHMHRTQSEVQLCEDMETAEQRDLNMFYRLVNGIRERQMNLVRENESSVAAAAFYNPAHGLTEAERSLAHIIHTRNAPVDRKSTSGSGSGSGSTNGRTNSSSNITRRSNSNSNSNNNLLVAANNHHPSLNSGVPILEENHPYCDVMDQQQEQQQQQQQHERDGAVHDINEWSVAGFDNSSNLSIDRRQHDHYQQHLNQYQHQPALYHGYAVGGGTATATTPIQTTLYPSQSSGNIVDEGMFDFEL